MPRYYRALLALNLLYCGLGLATRFWPSWRMFARVEELNFTLQDSRGETIDVHDFLPRAAYVNELAGLGPVLSFICTKRPELAPFRFQEKIRGVDLVIPKDHCDVSF